MQNLLIPILIAAGIFIASTVQGYVNQFSFEVVSTNFKYQSGKPVIEVNATVFNPTPITVNITAINLTASVNGVPIGNVESYNTTAIEPSTQTPITAIININTGGILQNLMQGNIQAETVINIAGYAVINGFEVPINYNHNIKLFSA